MNTFYGVLAKVANADDRADYEAIYTLFNTKDGKRACRAILAEIGSLYKTPDALNKWIEHMENGMGIEHYSKLVGKGLHPESVFLAQLIAKRGIIDEAAGPQHGKHTHRLQWAIVAKAHEKGILVLKRNPGDLYKAIGNEAARNIWQSSTRGVWDDLFDHDSQDIFNAGASYGFGCPVYFCTTWLRRRMDKQIAHVEEENKKYMPGGTYDQYIALAVAFELLEETDAVPKNLIRDVPTGN